MITFIYAFPLLSFRIILRYENLQSFLWFAKLHSDLNVQKSKLIHTQVHSCGYTAELSRLGRTAANECTDNPEEELVDIHETYNPDDAVDAFVPDLARIGHETVIDYDENDFLDGDDDTEEEYDESNGECVDSGDVSVQTAKWISPAHALDTRSFDTFMQQLRQFDQSSVVQQNDANAEKFQGYDFGVQILSCMCFSGIDVLFVYCHNLSLF